MRAMVLERPGGPLVLRDLPVPPPAAGQLQMRVHVCGICRTDLHVLDGDLTEPVLPLVPGHQIIGEVTALGEGVTGFRVGDRVGVPWLGWTCEVCSQCVEGRENLCERARFTGYELAGGFAEYTVADARYAFAVPEGYPDAQAAPLMCAGLIGYRALGMCGDARRLGLYGFGAAAHILAQVALHQGREVYAFTRAGDAHGQAFAKELGAVWAGGSDERPPAPLDAAILFAPIGSLVVEALRSVRPGGRVVCGGIHMSDIPSFPYALLWGERSVCSVANLTRQDGREFLALAHEASVQTRVTLFDLEEANEALEALREGRFDGAGALRIAPSAGGL